VIRVLVGEVDLGWPKTVLTGAFTASCFASAALAPLWGHQIDSGRARQVLIGGSIGAALGMAALSQVETVAQFYAVWIWLGAAMAACLYEPCFAYLIQQEASGGAAARPRIVHVTLMAGFAGTLSFPTAGIVTRALNWRAATLVFATMVALVVVPLFVVSVESQPSQHKKEPEPDLEKDTLNPKAQPELGSGQGATSGHTPDRGSGFCTAVRKPVFWYLASAYACLQGEHAMLITHLLMMLAELGVEDGTAVLCISLIGPGQVCGRVWMVLMGDRVSMSGCFVAMCAAMATAQILLMLVAAGGAQWLIFPAVTLQGGAVGMGSITRPVLTKELLGTQDFGAISGLIASTCQVSTALAPTLGALLWVVGGDYHLLRGAMTAMVGIGLVGFALARQQARQADRRYAQVGTEDDSDREERAQPIGRT
jgi:MFS family permease